MTVFEIEGGQPLYGEVTLAGAKNAALPMLFAGCLSDDETVLEGVPTGLGDVIETVAMLRQLGAFIATEGDTVRIRRGDFPNGLSAGPYSKTRCSLLLLGLGAALGETVRIAYPGGCEIGKRNHDIHLDGLRALGAKVREEEREIELSGGLCRGAEIELRYPSSTGTINLVLAAVLADGDTLIRNPSLKPEVRDVLTMLGEMGAEVATGRNEIMVSGVRQLHGARYRVMSDRLVAATVIAGVAMTRGQAMIGGASLAPISVEARAWRNAGMMLQETVGGVLAQMVERPAPISIQTGPYPMFHSDIQPLHGAMMTLAGGKSRIVETVFDSRFGYLDELHKMGAGAKVRDGGFVCANGQPGQIAEIRGVRILKGANVTAPDIRGGAALVVGGLAADGITIVGNVGQIDRGYERIEELMALLGGRIRRREAVA
ncbi:MAG: UDP-N-acetylglucosamine 1-carboxyvinyltransferase [Ectothiorhodospiraceae bacterium]